MTRIWIACKYALALFVLGVVASSCANDGRDLAEAQDWQTTTTRPPPPTSALPQGVSDSGMTLSSPDFDPGTETPLDAMCAGSNVFPTLEIANVPVGTAELGVTLSDQTDPTKPVLLWLMGGISADRSTLDSGVLPAGAYETLNDYGQYGWGNPCLENLSLGRRDLQFRLYAMTTPADIAAGDPGNEAWDTLSASAYDNATLLMTIEATG